MPCGVKLFSTAVLLAHVLSVSTLAQEADIQEDNTQQANPLLNALQGDLFEIEIQARIIKNSEHVVWEHGMTETTILGRALNLRLNGSNLILESDFTPYRQDEDNIMLIVRTESWVKHRATEKLAYQASVKSIPIRNNEAVIFYPLGLDPENDRAANLEIEILISPKEDSSSLP